MKELMFKLKKKQNKAVCFPDPSLGWSWNRCRNPKVFTVLPASERHDMNDNDMWYLVTAKLDKDSTKPPGPLSTIINN